VKYEALRRIEHGDGRRELVERAGMRLRETLQVRPHGLELRDVLRDTTGTVRDRRLRDVEHPAGACHDRRDAGVESLPGLAPARGLETVARSISSSERWHASSALAASTARQ
jgi:hypothetical protein